MSKATSTLIGLLGMAAVLLFSSCSQQGQRHTRSARARPNVLLITFDTTRADHIGAYGCKYAFTPTLDTLASQSVKFNRAFSSVPETLPAHVTIMTGLHAFYHGVRDNSHFVASPALKTLAETLKDNGYQTAAVVAAFVLDSRFGLDQGFDTYDDQVRPTSEFARFAIPERKAAAVTDAAIKWLDAADDDRPFFLWTHYYDPHSSYEAPDSFTRYQGHPYDVEIAYADTQLGRLLDHLAEKTAGGRPTLIVFTADHGEALGQYGEPTHAYFAYDSTLHVPLLLRMPDGSHAGEEIDLPVGLVDIMPTILDILGLPVPGENEIHGQSLVALLGSTGSQAEFSHKPIAVECYEPHYAYGWAALRGVRVGEVKFIDQPQPELYILSESKRETPATNLYAERPELAGELEDAYRELFQRELSFPSLAVAPQTPDQDAIEQLRALGYAGGEVAVEPEEGGKDLKEMLPIYAQILQAMGLASDGEAGDAVDILLKLGSAEPENRRIWWLLSDLAATAPEVAEESLPALEDALAKGLVPAEMVPQFLVNCGRAWFAKNDDQRALKCFSEAVELDQSYAGAYWWLGMTRLRLGEAGEAAEALRRAADLFGTVVIGPRVALVLALFANGKKEKAVAACDRLLGDIGSPESIWNVAMACPQDEAIAEVVSPALQRFAAEQSSPGPVRAVVLIACANYLSMLQQYEPALETLKSAVPPLPEDDPGLQAGLATLHLRLGRTELARALLERAYRTAPDRLETVEILAQVLEQTGERARAAEVLEGYYQAHPDSPIAQNNLAWILATQGKDLDRALKLVRRALSREPANPSIIDTMGWIYHIRGDREMAVRYLSKAARISPENATYRYHLGVAHQATGELDLAREELAKAVALAPTPRPSWYEHACQAIANSEHAPPPSSKPSGLEP